MNDEIRAKFQAQDDFLGKVKVLLEDAKMPEVLYNKVEQSVEHVQDVALIQCFYGTDIARIRATTQALEFNFQMTRKPKTWVFVEAQKRKSDSAFSWVSKYGIKYVFVKTTDASDGILLKNPLWNIGAAKCSEPKLLFLDSDVVMCNSNWVEKCAYALERKDVISLASHQYAQTDETCTLHETIGHRLETSGDVVGSHCGYTIGMTRKTLKEIGGFDPALILDDFRTFHKLVGDDVFKPFSKWTSSFKLKESHNKGYNFRLGYAENVACHIWHGDDGDKYGNICKLLMDSSVSDMDDLIKYEPSRLDELPTWRTGKMRPVAIKTIITNNDGGDMGEEYAKEMRKLLGCPDETHPVFVCSVIKDGFGLKLEDFVNFKLKVESRSNPREDKFSPTVVFFTDCTKFDFKESGIDALPLKLLGKGNSKVEMCARSNVFRNRRNSTIMYIPFNFTEWDKLNLSIWVPDEETHFFNGTSMIRV